MLFNANGAEKFVFLILSNFIEELFLHISPVFWISSWSRFVSDLGHVLFSFGLDEWFFYNH